MFVIINNDHMINSEDITGAHVVYIRDNLWNVRVGMRLGGDITLPFRTEEGAQKALERLRFGIYSEWTDIELPPN